MREKCVIGGTSSAIKVPLRTVAVLFRDERLVSVRADGEPGRQVRVRTCLCRAAAIDWVPSVTEAVCGVSDRPLLGDSRHTNCSKNCCEANSATVSLGSQAALQSNTSLMSALGWIADILFGGSTRPSTSRAAQMPSRTVRCNERCAESTGDPNRPELSAWAHLYSPDSSRYCAAACAGEPERAVPLLAQHGSLSSMLYSVLAARRAP